MSTNILLSFETIYIDISSQLQSNLEYIFINHPLYKHINFHATRLLAFKNRIILANDQAELENVEDTL